MSKPISVGITGGIGSGKTMVTKLFALFNVPIYNADIRAKNLMNTQLVDEISLAFGTQSYKKGCVNRNYLAAKVFSNKKQLAKLNSIVHPAVALDFDTWMAQKTAFTYVIKEAALLIETDSFKQLDSLIVITAPTQLRVQRVKLRDLFRSEQEIENIILSQTSDAFKLKFADFVISNDENHMLIPQVIEIDKKLR